MTAEAQRIAIAEALGYTQEEPWLDGRDCWSHKEHPTHMGFDVIPDYLNDLNACHEFEKVLDKMTGIHEPSVGICTGNEVYEDMLLGMCDHPIRATAAQRCEAFLKTIGKWKNDN